MSWRNANEIVYNFHVDGVNKFGGFQDDIQGSIPVHMMESKLSTLYNFLPNNFDNYHTYHTKLYL